MMESRGTMKLSKMILTLIIFGTAVESLRLPRVVVPPYKMYHGNATLECPFQLERRDRLYSVKWYKNNEEFFRYVPKNRPPIKTHRVQGIKVLMQGSDKRTVMIGPVNLMTTGIYRCEVSTEGPTFTSRSGEGFMTVVRLPEEGPEINGTIQKEGDYLTLRCSSSKSYPPANLSWYINDIQVEEGVEQVAPINYKKALDSLREVSSISTLNMTLKGTDFNENGESKIRCRASISTLFWTGNDEKIVGGGSGGSFGASGSSTDSRSTIRNTHVDVVGVTNPRKSNSQSNNEFRSLFNPAPVFQDFREASFLVRSGSWSLTLSHSYLLATFILPISIL